MTRALLLLIVLSLLVGCGSSSSSGPMLSVETEHQCAESRYFTITNIQTHNVSLEGWIISDDNISYTMPRIVLAPGGQMTVWRGTGQDDANNLYLGQPHDTWQLNIDAPVLERPHRPFGRVEMYFMSCHTSLPLPL